MWAIFSLILVLGPGAFVLGRWQITEKEPSRDQLIGVLLWTYIMLFIQFKDLHILRKDHSDACYQLNKRLNSEDSEGMKYDPGSVEDWDSCYRYTDDYAEGEAALTDDE